MGLSLSTTYQFRDVSCESSRLANGVVGSTMKVADTGGGSGIKRWAEELNSKPGQGTFVLWHFAGSLLLLPELFGLRGEAQAHRKDSPSDSINFRYGKRREKRRQKVVVKFGRESS